MTMSRVRAQTTGSFSSGSTAAEPGETELWTKICGALRKLADVESAAARAASETGRAEGDGRRVERVRELYDKQIELAQQEKRLLDQAVEDSSILIALRQATDSGDGKRKKRKVDEPTPEPAPKNFKKARSNSLVPQDMPVKGSQVAFRLKKAKGSDGEWIQCEVTKVLGDGNKIRFEVQDPEPDENNNPGQSYKATLKDIIRIPDPTAELLPHPVGARVLARYPETTTFYKAEVIGTKRDGTCRLKFEGEEEVGKETEVERRLVLEMPK
ncbi:SGF29 tudor-like domain-containing protein [Dipodascopsis tothii]|uniref:SGF29 tudor-like domain-containing protein n=1 Tax=Dipodascopsis tothii TaxID=44089 RepID=UPI0034CE8D64